MTEADFERPPKSTPQDVIDYEIKMLEHCFARALEAKVRLTALTDDDFAFLEAFLLHFRVLLEFFEGRASHADDLTFRAMHFDGAPPPSQIADRAEKLATALARKWRFKLNKFLVHTTTLRHTKKRSWTIEAMRTEMQKLVALYEAQKH